MPSTDYSSLSDFIFFGNTFVRGGFSYPGSSYYFDEGRGSVTYILDQPNASTGYYNIDPAVTVSGRNLSVRANGTLSGKIEKMVFASDNRGEIATISGLSLAGSDFTDILLNRIDGDRLSGSRFDEFLGTELVNLSTGDNADSVSFAGFLPFLDRLDLGAGDDTLRFSNNSDFSGIVEGGAGFDILNLSNFGSHSLVEVDLSVGEIRDDIGTYRFSGFEKIVGSARIQRYIGSDGADNISAAGLAVSIDGAGGDDILDSSWGDDIVDAGSGNDTVHAGAGEDTVRGGGGNDRLDGQDGADILYGQQGNDFLVGGLASDLLFGGSGHDKLSGGAASDRLFGGLGADTLDGGGNSDYFVIDALDTVTDTGAFGYDKAQINDSSGIFVSLDGWIGVERIIGFIGNDSIDASTQSTGMLLFGNSGDDVLTGGSGKDVIIGGDGDDTLIGNDGDDVLLGGNGNDHFDGGSGNDLFFVGELGDVVVDGGIGFDRVIVTDATGITLNTGAWKGVERINGLTGNDKIDASGLIDQIVLVGSDGDDVLTGGEAGDVLYGGADDDLLSGASGNDALIGSLGSDTIDGGAGDDFYLGGAGADTFLWTDNFGKDVVKDFTDDIDRLDFAGLSTVNDLSDLVISQSGSHTTITLAAGGSDMITLVNTQALLITDADIDFV